MLIKMVHGMILIKQPDEVQSQVIRSWPGWKSVKAAGLLQGPANTDSLNRLSRMVRLPAYMETERLRLDRIRRAVDAERVRPDAETRCYRRPPVKTSLFKHQQRAYNMALLTFGLIKADGGDGNAGQM